MIWGLHSDTKTMWGTEVRVLTDPISGEERWEPIIERPFEQDGKLYKTINEKILESARERNITLMLNGRSFKAPSKKDLSQMRKDGKAKIIQGYYGKPFKVYMFEIGTRLPKDHENAS